MSHGETNTAGIRLKGKKVVVLGGSSGIGHAVADTRCRKARTS